MLLTEEKCIHVKYTMTSYLPARVLRLMRYWKFEISPRTQRWVTEVSPIREEKRPVACSTLADLRTNQRSVLVQDSQSEVSIYLP